jgi:hypothetical protein
MVELFQTTDIMDESSMTEDYGSFEATYLLKATTLNAQLYFIRFSK